MALVEIIGVSPTGKSFVIAYVLVMGEWSGSYAWVLERLRDLLLGGYPNVIVTDRELGLIGAIKEVFPESNHLLCIWHIYNAVESRALKSFNRLQGDNARLFSRYFFRDMVQATSIEKYERAWKRMRACFYEKANLLSYVSRMWGSCVEKWSMLYTNKLFHLGNTSTWRVESAHSLLKTWLGTSKNGLDRFWAIAHDMIEGQQREIRSSLQESISRGYGVHVRYGSLFSLLRGKVTLKAVILMREEFDRGVELGERLNDECGCALVTTHDLLCACRLHYCHVNNMKVHPNDLHDVWSTLTYEPPDLNERAPIDTIDAMMDTIRTYDVATQRVVLETLHACIYPEEREFFEPKVVQIPKGRPRTSTTRNLSLVEHLRRRYPSTSTTPATQMPPGTSPTTPMTPPHSVDPTSLSKPPRSVSYQATFNSASGAPLEINFIRCSVDLFPGINLLPTLLLECFDAYDNPKGDGHCGFRCISSAALGDENEWSPIRFALRQEIERPVYRQLYVAETYNEFTRVSCPAYVTHVSPSHWMVGVDLFGFSTFFNWAICLISVNYSDEGLVQWTGSSTYLPVRAPAGVDAPYGVLWLLHTGMHFMRLRVVGDSPMPSINFLWERNHNKSVNGWHNLYTTKIEEWLDFLIAM